MAGKEIKGNQGIRYSDEQKAEMAQFIADFNEKNKRGGMKAASDKYGVSVVTLSNWGKTLKGPKKGKSKAKAKAPKAVKTAVVKSPVVTDDADVILRRLQAIRSEISALEKEYNTLKKKL
ncbi:MAG: hypothetical protein K9N35_03685 [Candidatus Marinimicrobia bacterium]|nr:hypothetical protein [Candidatus Neomarinimicrobiota bacterium]